MRVLFRFKGKLVGVQKHKEAMPDAVSKHLQAVLLFVLEWCI
jgi:hypothetical protein